MGENLDLINKPQSFFKISSPLLFNYKVNFIFFAICTYLVFFLSVPSISILL